MGGEPCIGGTRITSACIYSVYLSCRSSGYEYAVGRIRSMYPHLLLPDISAAISFEQGRIYERRCAAVLRKRLRAALKAMREVREAMKR